MLLQLEPQAQLEVLEGLQVVAIFLMLPAGLEVMLLYRIGEVRATILVLGAEVLLEFLERDIEEGMDSARPLRTLAMVKWPWEEVPV